MNSSASKYPRLLGFKNKLERPMLFLSFVWFCILIIEIVYGSIPVLSGVGSGIWILFIFYFALRLAIVADRLAFLKNNWLFILAIVVSALRFFPFLQPFPLVHALTATFGMQVIWIFASADQGMRFLRVALGRRGAGYALALTFVVLFAGAAGMLHFEAISDDAQRLQTYPKALWWTAMQMTNIGSAYSIKTTGGRIICLGISVYAAVMFGYLTALFATLLIDRVAQDPKPEIARQKMLQEVKDEIIQLRRLIEEKLGGKGDNSKSVAISQLESEDVKALNHRPKDLHRANTP
jgi:voltage-gated potassium channel